MENDNQKVSLDKEDAFSSQSGETSSIPSNKGMDGQGNQEPPVNQQTSKTPNEESAYDTPYMQGNPNMYGNPNMQGNPNMYGNPNMQGGPNMYGNPNTQGNPNMYGNPNMQGGPSPVYTYNGYQTKSDGYAIASLIFGILSLFSSFCYGVFGILLSIPAIVLANISKSKSKADKMPGLALGGLVTGILGFLIGCIILGLICYIVVHMNDTNSIWYSYMKDFMNELNY